MNLLEETLEYMAKYGKCEQDVKDVRWDIVTNRKVEKGYVAECKVECCSWELFAIVAAHIEYDEGFGAQEINASLVILFNDGTWLERSEYDGAEGWDYKCPPRSGDIFTVNLKEIKKNIWENPCSCCVYGEHMLDSDRCDSCRSFSKWEEK